MDSLNGNAPGTVRVSDCGPSPPLVDEELLILGYGARNRSINLSRPKFENPEKLLNRHFRRVANRDSILFLVTQRLAKKERGDSPLHSVRVAVPRETEAYKRLNLGGDVFLQIPAEEESLGTSPN